TMSAKTMATTAIGLSTSTFASPQLTWPWTFRRVTWVCWSWTARGMIRCSLVRRTTKRIITSRMTRMKTVLPSPTTHSGTKPPSPLFLPHCSKADQENPPTAEDHYTADYPEDEVDSDDEYGRHAYYFRNRNASDEEEFDNDLY